VAQTIKNVNGIATE